MQLDIFCHVIDFWGDVAVSLRLALALKQNQPLWTVRFFSDGQRLLPQLFPSLTATLEPQQLDGVEILSYNALLLARTQVSAPIVALEMFGCTLPVSYNGADITINIEYFTAESWSKDFHKQASYWGQNSVKYFFMPSIYPQTGGLTWGRFFEDERAIRQDKLNARKTFLKAIGALKLDAEAPWVSFYLYNIDFELFKAEQDCVFITPSSYQEALPKNCFSSSKIGLKLYDQLILLSDFNLVRGEDSLSRALLAGLPFLWQAYRQEDEVHLLKLQALLACWQPLFTDIELFGALKKQFFALNEQNTFDIKFMKQQLKPLTEQATLLTTHIKQLNSLEVNLANFILELAINL